MRSLSSPNALSIKPLGFVSRHGRACLLFIVGALGCATALQVPRPARQSAAPSGSPDYGRIESEVLVALNRARTDPQGTAADLDALTRYYNGKLFQRPGHAVPTQTNEGVSAAREAEGAARAQRPLNALTLSAGLTQAARDQANDQQRTGGMGHTSSDGSTTVTRIQRYGTWHVTYDENIDYSPMVHGSDVIQNLLIDDGVPDRGHRRNIFDPSVKVVGIACGPHPRFGSVCVIVQAGGFTPK
jgi:uncharacterized protein YkwD